jgi:hypothetical protein
MPAVRGGLVSARLSGARGGRRTGGPPGKALQRAGHKVYPVTEITALQRVVFVMKGGKVYGSVAPGR